MTVKSPTALDANVRHLLRRLRLQLDRLATAPMAGKNRSVQRGRGLEFDQVIRYAYGDDIREIDWNVSARLGDLYRKSFVEDREIKLVCVFADHPALQFGSGATAKRSRLIDALSLLLLLAMEQQQTISLLHMHGGTVTKYPFTRDRGRILRMITELHTATAPAVTEPGPSQPPAEHLRHLGKGHLIMWFGEIPENSPAADWLALARRHSTLAIRVEDQWERYKPAKAMIAFDPLNQCLVERAANRDDGVSHREWQRKREQRWAQWWPRPDQRLVIDNNDDSDTFIAVSGFLGRRRTIVRTPVG